MLNKCLLSIVKGHSLEKSTYYGVLGWPKTSRDINNVIKLSKLTETETKNLNGKR